MLLEIIIIALFIGYLFSLSKKPLAYHNETPLASHNETPLASHTETPLALDTYPLIMVSFPEIFAHKIVAEKLKLYDNFYISIGCGFFSINDAWKYQQYPEELNNLKGKTLVIIIEADNCIDKIKQNERRKFDTMNFSHKYIKYEELEAIINIIKSQTKNPAIYIEDFTCRNLLRQTETTNNGYHLVKKLEEEFERRLKTGNFCMCDNYCELLKN